MYINFGSITNVNTAFGNVVNYKINSKDCPDDGFISFSNKTSNCFNGKWIAVMDDHTPGDRSGNMMIVNASTKPGAFLRFAINGLEPGTTYQLAAWVVNIFKSADGCTPKHPNLFFLVQTKAGIQVANFSTGTIQPLFMQQWQKLNGIFTTPANEIDFIVTIADINPGGCGNDFVMDDITICKCEAEKITPPILAQPDIIKEPIKKPDTAVAKVTHMTENKAISKAAPLPKAATVGYSDEIVIAAPNTRQIVPDTQSKVLPTIKLLTARENPVVKIIQTTTAELQVALYDNGEIDGDTVSIYHNNILIVDRQRLSASPILIKIPVDEQHAHHELVMVANNLGSIPPNTSLMVITVNGKRYETFISTNEQKNAKLVVDWKRE